jgi:Uma2 family endonuclease
MTSEHTSAMSVEQYFELEENSPDTRYEYFDGYVYTMSGGSANHAAISGNIYAILRSLLR